MLAGTDDGAPQFRYGYDDQVARIGRSVRRTVETRVDVPNDETCSCKEMLEFETEEVQESVLMCEVLRPSVGIRYVEGELGGEGLTTEIAIQGSVPADDLPTIWKGRRFLRDHVGSVQRTGKLVNRRLRHIEDERALRLNMAVDCGEASQLLFHR